MAKLTKKQKAILDIALKNQTLVERLKSGFVKDYLKVFGEIDTAISGILGALKIKDLGELTKKELDATLRELRVAQTDLYLEYNDELMDELKTFSRFQIGAEARALNALGGQVWPPTVISSKGLKIDEDSMRDKSKAYWKKVYAEGDPTEIARGVKPIIINKDGDRITLQDGRHRLTEAEAAGATEINATFIEYDESGDKRISQETRVVAIGEMDTGPILSVPRAADSWASVLERPLGATGKLLEPFTKDIAAPALDRIEGAVRKGWAEGKTVSEVMSEIRGTRAAKFKDGLIATNRRNAEAMVRTATQHVSNTSRLALYEHNDDLIKGYRWLSTMDGATTAQCRSLDKQKFEFGKGPIPPIHINCRSTIIPELGEEWDFLDEGATRSSEDGYVDAEETYYDWLKGKSTAYQDDVLGPTRGKLFRGDGMSPSKFAQLNMDKNFRPLTLAEMKEKDPEAWKAAGLN